MSYKFIVSFKNETTWSIAKVHLLYFSFYHFTKKLMLPLLSLWILISRHVKHIYFHPSNLPMMHLVGDRQWCQNVLQFQTQTIQKTLHNWLCWNLLWDITDITSKRSSFCSYFSLQRNDVNVTSKSSIRSGSSSK